MSREIRIGDQVRVGLFPDHYIYDIEDIDKDGWIYIVAEEGNKQGILVHKDSGTKVLGSENIPYTIEFLPKDKLVPQAPRFDGQIKELTGDSHLDFQIVKNLDEPTLSELARSTSEYVRKLAYKGMIYQKYGVFIEDYGLEHDFKKSYNILESILSEYTVKYVMKSRILASNDLIAIDYLFNKSQYPLISHRVRDVKKWMLDWAESHNKFKLRPSDELIFAINNNLVVINWLLERGYELDNTIVNRTVQNGLTEMVMLLDKYGYHPTSYEVDMALGLKFYNLAEWMMNRGFKPTSDIFAFLVDLDPELTRRLSAKYNIFPDEFDFGIILRSSNIDCDTLDWLTGFVLKYPKFAPGGTKSDEIINIAMENNCYGVVDRLLEMGYIPNNITERLFTTNGPRVIVDGNLELAKVFAKHGYRLENWVLKSIRDSVIVEQAQLFYPGIPETASRHQTSKQDKDRLWQIYKLFTQ